MNTSDIQVGEYFVTIQGDIGQVTNLCVATNTINSDIGLIFKYNIALHGKRLNDLVEAGDYINGARVAQSSTGRLSCNGTPISSVVIQQFMSKRKFFKECYSVGLSKDTKWKLCYEHDGYEVSDNGLVREMETGRLLPIPDDKKQKYVRLATSKTTNKVINVANLVLEAFVEPSNGRTPIYIDGDTHNCNVNNLKWGDYPPPKKVPKPKPVREPRNPYKRKIDGKLQEPTINIPIKRVYEDNPYNKYPKNSKFDEGPTAEDLKEIERDNFKRKLKAMMEGKK